MSISAKTRKNVVIIAFCAMLLFITIRIIQDNTGEYKHICDTINSLGYHFVADDLLVAYDERDTTIAAVLDSDTDLEIIIEESQYLGFPSDIEKHGDITLVLATEGSEVVALYLVNGNAELCFIQDTDGNIIRKSGQS